VRDEVASARALTEKAGAELDALRKEAGDGQPMSAADAARVKRDYMRLRKVYLDRRRTCMEVLGNMGEVRARARAPPAPPSAPGRARHRLAHASLLVPPAPLA
jgi:hypothetical protein